MAQQERRERNETLLNIGYRSYEFYLSSDLWKWIREEVVSQKGSTCCCCKRTEYESVHHEFYDLETM